MKKRQYTIYNIQYTILLFCLTLSGCGIYNFTGTGQIDADTFQVNYFLNNAELVEPGIERTFTIALQDLIQGQTSLSLTNSNGRSEERRVGKECGSGW